MKTKLSISVNDELVALIDEKLKEGLFRNKSHVIEYAIKEFLRNGKI